MTQEQILKARDWLMECAGTGCFHDITCKQDIVDLPDKDVQKGIKKYYGIEQFKEDCESWTVVDNW